MSNNSFQKKYKDQIQVIGKGGINSIQSIQPIQAFPNNNFFTPQNQQNMMINYMNQNMNYQNQNMNFMNQNYIPQQQFKINNKINKNKINKNNNDFKEWAEIYNKEVKNKKSNNSKIKSSGEMIISNNNKKENNIKIKVHRKQKSITPQPQVNINMDPYNQFQMNPQMIMNNSNFNPYTPYQQMMIPMNNNFNQQMNINNNYNNNNNYYNNNNNNNNYYNNNNNYYNNNNNYFNQIGMNLNNNMNNNYNQIQINNNINNENSKNNLSRNNKSYNYVEYKPYTLKDYKELTRSKVIMGPLGANIGTKEWEEKKAKMKRMETYSNRINQTHKGITKLKKETPQEEIEKNLKLKMEKSNRYRTYEYGKLILSARGNNELNSKISAITGNNDNYYKDLGIINENEEYKLKTGNMKNYNNNSNSYNIDLNDPNNFIPLVKATENTNDNIHKIHIPYKSEMSDGNEENNNFDNENNNYNKSSLQSLIQQNQDYKAKIDDIKNSLL